MNIVVVVKSVRKTVVITVLRIELVLAREMKRGMTIEYLMCRADLNFEVDFRGNCAIGTIVTKWDRIVFG